MKETRDRGTLENEFQSRTMRQAFYRLLPILILAYLTAFLDRVNIANAALTMNASIGLSAHMFGLGAGLFFISYFIFGPPSNLILERVGARYWIAPMVIGLGALSMAMALVKGLVTFLILRFLLGAAEAGVFPGVILYLTYWFPSAYRSRITAAFMMAIPASLAIGGPISNVILHASGAYGIEGWQWLFILEGAPTVVLGCLMYFLLPDRPQSAKWLSLDQKEWITSTLKAEADKIRVTGGVALRKAFFDPSVLLLSLIYLGNITTNLGIAFFLPLIIKSLGVTTKQTNYISAIPYVTGMIGIFIFGSLSDRFKERRRLILAISLVISFVGLAGAGFVNAISFGGPLASSYVSIGMVSVAAIGIYGAKAPFWPLPSLFLTGSAAAGGIAFINAIGNLGGFIGPFAVGWMKDTTHSYSFALYALASFGLMATLATLFLHIPGAGGPLDPARKEVKAPTASCQRQDWNRRDDSSMKTKVDIITLLFMVIMLASILARAQQLQEAPASAIKGTGLELPNPYPHRSTDWAQLPSGETWPAVVGALPGSDGNLYVADRCFQNSCEGRLEAPVLVFSSSGKLLRTWGVGDFIFPHGYFMDSQNSLWFTDAAGAGTTTGGVPKDRGDVVLKFDRFGKLLQKLGKDGVSGDPSEGLFTQPTAVITNAKGEIFVAEGHDGDIANRISKFTADGRFIKTIVTGGDALGQVRIPHCLAFDSKERLFVCDRGNNRISIFDQDGHFLEAWKQFGRPSGILIAKDDTMYVTDSESGGNRNPGWPKGIRIGSAKTGRVWGFIPDPQIWVADPAGAEQIAIYNGSLFGAVVRRRELERFSK